MAQERSRETDRGAETRARIIDAAEVVFSRYGYAAARLEEVAVSVGIRRASIIHYFAGKRELFQAVEQRLYSALAGETLAAIEGVAGARPRLLAIVDTWLAFLAARPAAARLILRLVADGFAGADDTVAQPAPLLAMWNDLVREGVRTGEFVDFDPLHLLSVLGSSILMFATTSVQLGNQSYDNDDISQVEKFRQMLHRLVDSFCRTPAGSADAGSTAAGR